jgi:hypothetical protein
MKTTILAVAALVLAHGVCSAWAARTSASYAISSEEIGGGGQPGASAHYAIESSLGGIGGMGSGGSVVAHAGYLGQVTEVTNVQVTAAPPSVDEGSATQLGGAAALDDGTVSILAGGDLAWQPPAFPVASINAGGLATASAVYQQTAGAVTGAYLGVSGSGALTVRDSHPDNYRSYAGDGLPDWWQVKYFGEENPDAAASANPDGDDPDNRQEYVADTQPNNPNSFFEILSIRHTNKWAVTFNCSTARVYSLFSSVNLPAGIWQPMQSFTNWPGLPGGTLTMTTTNDSNYKCYSVRVALP